MRPAENVLMLCGSGVGACIAANKVTGARAAVCHDTFSAALNKDKLTPDFIAHSIVISNPGQFDAEITINIVK